MKSYVYGIAFCCILILCSFIRNALTLSCRVGTQCNTSVFVSEVIYLSLSGLNCLHVCISVKSKVCVVQLGKCVRGFFLHKGGGAGKGGKGGGGG